MLHELKPDIRKMIELSKEIGEYNQIYLSLIDCSDMMFFDLERAEKVSAKIKQLQNELNNLTDKWDIYKK